MVRNIWEMMVHLKILMMMMMTQSLIQRKKVTLHLIKNVKAKSMKIYTKL
jgi:hypothetical protein